MNRRLPGLCTLLNSTSNLICADNPVQLASTASSRQQWHSQEIDIFGTHPLTLPCNQLQSPTDFCLISCSANERVQTQLA